MNEPIKVTKIEQATGQLKLTTADHCDASVILKRGVPDTSTTPPKVIYDWWLVAGRYGKEAETVVFPYKGEDLLRFDVPNGTPLSAHALQSALKAFVNAGGGLPPGDPTVKGVPPGG